MYHFASKAVYCKPHPPPSVKELAGYPSWNKLAPTQLKQCIVPCLSLASHSVCRVQFQKFKEHPKCMGLRNKRVLQGNECPLLILLWGKHALRFFKKTSAKYAKVINTGGWRGWNSLTAQDPKVVSTSSLSLLHYGKSILFNNSFLNTAKSVLFQCLEHKHINWPQFLIKINV